MWKVLLLKNNESCTLNDLLLKEELYGSYISPLSIALKIISNDLTTELPLSFHSFQKVRKVLLNLSKKDNWLMYFRYMLYGRICLHFLDNMTRSYIQCIYYTFYIQRTN